MKLCLKQVQKLNITVKTSLSSNMEFAKENRHGIVILQNKSLFKILANAVWLERQFFEQSTNAYKEYELPGGQTNCAWVQELNKYCKEQIPNANTIRLPDIYIYKYKYIQASALLCIQRVVYQVNFTWHQIILQTIWNPCILLNFKLLKLCKLCRYILMSFEIGQ